MNVTKLNRARRKLALQITEDIEQWIARHNGVLDVDEAAKDIAYLIPDTRAEAKAEWEEFFKALKRSNLIAQKPSLYRELCTALKLNGCSVTAVLKAAIKAVEDRKKLREVVAGLPYTEDSVHISLGDFLWRTLPGGGKVRCQVDTVDTEWLNVCDDGQDATETVYFTDSRFYSTEAALDAAEEE